MRRTCSSSVAEIRVHSCRIRRLTLGTLPVDKEELVSALQVLAEDTGETDAEELPIYYWLEDLDDVIYIDGPLFNRGIVIESENQYLNISTLMGLGATKKVVEEIVVDVPPGSLLGWTDMISEGELTFLHTCGESDDLLALLNTPSDDDSVRLEDLACNIEILVKIWRTPLGPFNMFVGLAYKANNTYEYKDHWGDGSYASDVKSTEAGVLAPAGDDWEKWPEDKIEGLVNEVCKLCE